MSRVTWQPSNSHRVSGSERSCHRRTRGSGETPCSKKMSLPPGYLEAMGATTSVIQGDAFARKAEEFNVEICLAARPLGQSHHLRIGFERIDLGDLRGIVVREVDAGAHADLQHLALGPADDPLPNRADGRGIPERLYDPWVDVITVEGHDLNPHILHQPTTRPLTGGKPKP